MISGRSETVNRPPLGHGEPLGALLWRERLIPLATGAGSCRTPNATMARESPTKTISGTGAGRQICPDKKSQAVSTASGSGLAVSTPFAVQSDKR